MLKRLADFILALLGFIVLSPVLLAIGCIIRLDSSGPAIFKQDRIGWDNQIFVLYKFRTMKTGTPDVATHLLKSPEERITRIGGFLRRTSLDEVPQLINVIKGDMSLVGPRPALYNQDDLIEGRRKLGINRLRPGLTGWAQINGRDEISIESKIELDHYYLEHQSLWLDLIILIKTVFKVYTAEGVAEGGKSSEEKR